MNMPTTRRLPQRGFTLIEILVAILIFSFGLLGLSRTPALQAFGLTMLMGTALVWLLVPCFGRENTDDPSA